MDSLKLFAGLLLASAAFAQSGGPPPVIRGTVPSNAPCVGSTNTTPPTLTTGTCATIAHVTNVIVGDGNGNGIDSGIPSSALITTTNSNTLSATRLTGVTFTAGSGISFGTTSFPALTISATGTGGCTGCLTPPSSFQGILAGGVGSSNTVVTSLLASLYSSSTGIAGAITACGGSATCNIVIPPTYTTGEQIKGFSLDPNNPGYNGAPTATGNISIGPDMRYGWGGFYANNNFGYNQGTINVLRPMAATYSSSVGQGGIVQILNPTQFFFDSGGVMTSQQNSLYYNKITETPLGSTLVSYNPAQHIALGLLAKSYSVGDTIGVTSYVYCPGGLVAQEDEGCHDGDHQVFENNTECVGTVSSVGSGNSTLTVAITQGSGTQGSFRKVINTTTGVISSGSLASINSPGGTFTTVTGTGTSWPSSSVVGTLGTTVSAPGTATVTPTFQTGTISGITTSTQVCVADPSGFEIVKPTSVSGSQFTASFYYAHASGSVISVGGLCGYLLDPVADEVTNSTFPTKTQTVQGTLRYAWPVGYSSSSTSLSLVVAAGGTFQQMQSRFCAVGSTTCTGSTATAAYRLYPFSITTSVQSGGTLSNTWAMMPNTTTWNTGDTVEMLPEPARVFKFGNYIVESYYPGVPNFAQGDGRTYNMPLVGNDAMWGLSNNTPFTMYLGNGGTYAAPYAIHIHGVNSGITVDQHPSGPIITSGCNVSGTGTTCSGLGEIFREGDAVASSYHSIFTDQTNGGFLFQTTYSTGPSFAVDYNPAYSASFAGPYQDHQISLGDPTHTWPQAYFYGSSSCANNPESGAECLYFNSATQTFRQVNSSGTDSPLSTGGLTAVGPFMAIANATNSTTLPTATGATGLMTIVGDDQTNAAGLGSSAPFRNTVFMNHVAGVTVGAGQNNTVRAANCTAMQSVFNNAAANNWKVEIPAGVYEIYCSAGLVVTQTNYDQSLWISGSQQSIVTQFYANAPILTVGDPSGSSDYSVNVNVDGIRLTYGSSQTGNTSANALIIGALRSSSLSHFWIGADGGTYVAPNTPYANPAYRAMYLPAASEQEFSNTFQDFFIQGAQYRILDFESMGTNSWFKNFYTTNGYAFQPGLISDSGWFFSNGEGHFVNMNLESVAGNTIINGQTLRGADFKSIHLESVQLSGNNPTIWVGGTNRIVIDDFDASGLYISSSAVNTLTATGSATVFSTYQDDALTVHNLNIQLQNSGNVVNLPLVIFNPLAVGDATPTIEGFNISGDDFVGGGLLANLSLDPNTPLANFAGPQRISRYQYHPGTSFVDGAVRPVSGAYTVYGQDTQPTIVIPASITSFTLTLADTLAASGTGSTAIPKVGNLIHVRRLSGTASGTLTIADAGAGTISTNATAATDLYFKFDGTRYRSITDSTSLASGAVPNTPATPGTYVATGTSYGTSVPISTPTLITPLPSCAAMGTSYTVTGATNASPIVITTSASNGLFSNGWVNLASVGGNTAANGLWQVSIISSTQFSLIGSTGNAAYTSGGSVLNASSGPCINSDGTAAVFTYVDKQSSTNYTIPTSDVGALVIYTGTSNASGWVIPQAATGSNFPVGKSISIRANSTGYVVITPSSGTIGGAANLTVNAGKGCRMTVAASSDYELEACN